MRTNVDKLLLVARAEVGYTEAPANSNRTKYGKWFGLDGLPWCGMFVSWCFAQAGVPLPNIGYTKGFAGCQTAALWFRKNGWVVKDPKPGDIVLFDWNGDGRFDHTGIVERAVVASAIGTIEGNTSATNQSNGGQVQQRTRSRKTCTMLFARNPNL